MVSRIAPQRVRGYTYEGGVAPFSRLYSSRVSAGWAQTVDSARGARVAWAAAAHQGTVAGCLENRRCAGHIALARNCAQEREAGAEGKDWSTCEKYFLPTAG